MLSVCRCSVLTVLTYIIIIYCTSSRCRVMYAVRECNLLVLLCVDSSLSSASSVSSIDGLSTRFHPVRFNWSRSDHHLIIVPSTRSTQQHHRSTLLIVD